MFRKTAASFLGAALLASGVLVPAFASAAPAGGESPSGGVAPHPQATTGTWARERKSDDVLSPSERDFVVQAAESGLLEVRAARLAVVRSHSPVVKKIATGYVMHHTAANAQLTRLANRWHVELPITAPRAKRRELEQLAAQKGAEFDMAFLQVMGVQEHEQAIERFESARRQIRHPQLRAWLDQTLPTLRQHLVQAHDAIDGRTAG